MGCCTSREPDQAPPLPPRENRNSSVDITHVRAPLSPVERRPTLPPRLETLNADQEAQIAGFAPPVPPKIPLLPPRPSEAEIQGPAHWRDVPAGIELADSAQNAPIPIPQIKLNRTNTSTLEYDPNPLPQPPRVPTPELENNVTPIYNSMVMSHLPQPPPATYHNNHYPDRYRSPVSELDPSELRPRTFSPVSAMDPMSRRQSLAVAPPKAGPYLELEAAPAGPHIELPVAGQHGQVEIELPAVPMVPMQATVSGPVGIHMYHELDGGFGAAEMPVR